MNAIFCALSAVICVSCLIGTLYFAQRATRAAASPLAKLRSAESRIASLETSQAEWTQLHEDLANRVKMMRVRNTTAGPRSSSDRQGDLPNPYTNPDEWRKAANAKLATAKLNGGG